MYINEHTAERREDHAGAVTREATFTNDYFARKAFRMRVVAAVLLVVFLPIILLLMLAVWLTSPGPALYRQMRLGKNNRPFHLLKIRTMYQNAEAVDGPALCLPGDSRITPLGRLLRFLHLDELPQLVNVVRGEMCLVGPRPEREEIVRKNGLRRVVSRFDERVQVLPGVTGLAQINLPADTDSASVVPKVQLDLEYIETATAGLDLRILLCTLFRMFGVRHGRAVRWFGLVRSPNTDYRSRQATAIPRSKRRKSSKSATFNHTRPRTASLESPAASHAEEILPVMDTCVLNGVDTADLETAPESIPSWRPVHPR